MSAIEVKGYYTGFDYMGFINGDYMRFESDAAYKEYMEEDMEDDYERNNNK